MTTSGWSASLSVRICTVAGGCVDRVRRRRHRDDLRVGVGHGPPAVILRRKLREGRVVALGGAVLTVETDTVGVEERLRSGGLACPGCGGVLAGWGRARARTVRGRDGEVRVCRGGRGAPGVGRPMCCCRCCCWSGARTRPRGSVSRWRRRRLEAGIAGSPSGWAGRGGRCAAGCGASVLESSRSGWCSPCGVGRWRRIRCCPGRPGPGGRTRSPR